MNRRVFPVRYHSLAIRRRLRTSVPSPQKRYRWRFPLGRDCNANVLFLLPLIFVYHFFLVLDSPSTRHCIQVKSNKNSHAGLVQGYEEDKVALIGEYK